MGKVKINGGLAIILLIASLFSNWQTFLIFVILMLIFCEIDEKIKNTIITITTFKIGVSIVSVGWGIIYDLIHAGLNCFDTLINLLTELEADPEFILTITKIGTIGDNVLGILSDIIYALITLTELAFAITILTGKKRNENFISKKINEYVGKAVNYVNNINLNDQMQNQPNNMQ